MLPLLDGQAAPITIRREAYAPPAFFIDTVELVFDLDPVKTRVLNRMHLRRNPEVPMQALRLDGEELDLSRVLVNGNGASFRVENQQLVIDSLPQTTEDESFEVELFTTCAPAKNTKLMGLFVSERTFFTQCEAEGFRRITYFLDRPDVMASYTVTLRADKAAYPVLLSNGNLVDEGDLPGAGNEGRHFAKWVDPFRKPSYLFALVAGQLVAREQRITARNGKQHLLQVFVRPGDLDKTEHAMNSLIHSVVWDEARFGLALDLDRFMIVATSDFNMGAMENKGLNIFNTKYVLASQATATDADFNNIESVVGHEYFHNWTGDRVTCRDWFQLSLKEGLTVFRDQEFSMDLCADASARAVKRIEDVRVLRTAQFPEDAGPMAHPVRPDSYVEISNFYTVTIYEKGAEVVRMMQTLVGRAGFKRGITSLLRSARWPRRDLRRFRRGYRRRQSQIPSWRACYPSSSAGTARLARPASRRIGDLRQSRRANATRCISRKACAPSAGQPSKEPMVIPVQVRPGQAPMVQALRSNLADPALATDRAHSDATGSDTLLLVLSEPSQSFTFTQTCRSEPVPSLLRGFSAPVVLDFAYSDAQLLTLLAHDRDPFNRWEAGPTAGTAQRLPRLRGGCNEVVG